MQGQSGSCRSHRTRNQRRRQFEAAESEKMRIRKRVPKDASHSANNVTVTQMEGPLVHNMGGYSPLSESIHSFQTYAIDSRRQLLPRSHEISTTGRKRDVITVQLSCLLIPVFLAAWWYWTKRKARSVISGLLHHSPQEGQESEQNEPDDLSDDFSTWCVYCTVVLLLL